MMYRLSNRKSQKKLSQYEYVQLFSEVHDKSADKLNAGDIKKAVLVKRQYNSRTSMARTSLGPWKFVRDMGSSSHRGLIMAQVQEAKSDNLGKSFRFSTQRLYVECTH